MFEAPDIIANIKKQVVSKYNAIFKKIMSSYVGLYAYYGITWYVKTSENVKQRGKRIYNMYPIVKTIVDHSLYVSRYLLAAINNQKIEPMSSKWICNTFLMFRDPNKFVGESFYYIDTYEFLKSSADLPDSYSGAVTSTDSILRSSTIIQEGMVTMKNENQYANTIYFKNKLTAIKEPIELPNELSGISFLSIKYTHPMMKDHIFIDIEKGYYYVNNEILSPLFIKRYLEHQAINYHFDMDYEIEIIDNDIQKFQLKSNQYILLGKSTYTVMNISE
jgi:hypothetical protein